MHTAIEFAKHLLQSKVTVKRNGKIGEETPSTSYHPSEFQLLLGQLEHNGKEVFEEWLSMKEEPTKEEAAIDIFPTNEERDKFEKYNQMFTGPLIISHNEDGTYNVTNLNTGKKSRL